MAKTGPKSAAEVSVVKVEFNQKAEPPPELTEGQAQIWRGIVDSEPVDYFCTAALKEILVDYCQHRDAAKSVSLIISTFKPDWMKSEEGARRYHALLRMRDLETRAALSCATKLRLTNQARYTPQAAATAARNRENQQETLGSMSKQITRGDQCCDWIEEHLVIPEGSDVGKPVVLRKWQRKEIKKIYDNPHGTRRAILSFGRKNAKTTMAAFLLLLHLVGTEAVQNSQLYSAAQSRDQAAILFSLAAKIVRLSPKIVEYVLIRDSAKQLVCHALGTMYRALSAESTTAYGLSPAFLVFDELGQCRGPRSALYDALETASSAHENPLSIIISTQAPTDNDLLSILIDDAVAGHDKRVVLSLYTANEDDDPFSVKTIKQANPAFGDFQNAKEVMAMAADAKRMPARESEFRNLVLNQRVQAESPFISRSVWETCGGEPEPFGMEPVYAGLDLSARADLTACVLMFERDEHKHVHAYFWLPEDGLAERSRRDRVPYDLWAQQGYLRTTPGGSVDYEYVVHDLAEILADVDLGLMTFDRWRIDEFTKEVERAGLDWPMEPHGQGFKDMSPALDSLEADLLNARLRHGMHPVLTMCAANAIVTTDPADNRKLDKKKANGRIDGMQALAMTETAMTRQPVVTYPVGRLIAL